MTAHPAARSTAAARPAGHRDSTGAPVPCGGLVVDRIEAAGVLQADGRSAGSKLAK